MTPSHSPASMTDPRYRTMIELAMWYAVVRLFLFQAEDGIRYADVTGVQTCALPISARSRVRLAAPVRHVWSHERLVAGPVSVLPPLEHPPSRPRLTPLFLAVFPRLATAALDLVFPALCAVCEARLGPRRRDPPCRPCWGASHPLVPPYRDRC